LGVGRLHPIVIEQNMSKKSSTERSLTRLFFFYFLSGMDLPPFFVCNIVPAAAWLIGKKGDKTSFILIEVIYNMYERLRILRKIYKIRHPQGNAKVDKWKFFIVCGKD
jgi:hypothetical protein